MKDEKVKQNHISATDAGDHSTPDARQPRQVVFLMPDGTPQGFMIYEDELDDFSESSRTELPPGVLDELVAGRLKRGMLRRRREELLQEAVRRDRPDALAFLLPGSRRIPLEQFENLLFAATESHSADVQAWLLQYRREHYSSAEWAAREARKIDLELGFAEPTLQELRQTFRISFAAGGICIGGVKKAGEKEYYIPAFANGKPVVSVNAAAFYSLSPIPRVSRSFAGERSVPVSGSLPEQQKAAGKTAAFSGFSGAEAGEVILFGRWTDKKNTAERPIAWRVIRREEDRVMLYCEAAVAKLPYHPELTEVSWESCALRQWLNRVFLPISFTPEERDRICLTAVSTEANTQFGTSGGPETQDRLFLLSAEEISARLPDPGQRATGSWYWTRSPGFDRDFAVTVTPEGKLTGMGSFVDAEDYGVRPAMWVCL